MPSHFTHLFFELLLMCRESNKWWGEWLSVWLLSLVSTLVSFRERGGCWGKLIYQGHHHCIDSTPQWGQNILESGFYGSKIIFTWPKEDFVLFLNFEVNLNLYVRDDIFRLIGSNLVPLCRQSFSMAMANQLCLLFKRKTKPFNVDLIQRELHWLFINAPFWFLKSIVSISSD
jgi:hypothetical protein